MTGLPFGAVESRLDRPIARTRIQALELDRYTVHARIGCASVDSEAFGHRNYRRTGARKVLRDSAFGCREPLGPLVNHAQTTAVDLALAQRDLPFVPLRGGPFGHQSREADDFIATSRSEDVVVLLPESRLGLGLNRLAIVGGLTGPRFFSRSIGLLVWLAGRAVYAHALMFYSAAH